MPIQKITTGVIESIANTQISGTITASQIATVNANTITSGTIPVAQVPQLTSAKMPAGSVVQVVSTTKNDTFSMTGGTFVDITGLSATITPTSATSKIFIMINFAMSSSSTGGLNTFNLVRNATNISQPATSPAFTGTMCAYTDLADMITPVSISFLDSPATTSSTTYKLQMKSNTGTQWINRRNGTDSAYTSTITVMEIAA